MSENKINIYLKDCMYVKYVKDIMTITFVKFISNLLLITILLKEILSYLKITFFLLLKYMTWKNYLPNCSYNILLADIKLKSSWHQNWQFLYLWKIAMFIIIDLSVHIIHVSS